MISSVSPLPLFSFKFMKHDRWANVLFLHWRVPVELEGILEQHASPFPLDRFKHDGCAYIGLILLTEEGVGPLAPDSCRIPSWTCVTHHGVNVRTYVQGPTPASTMSTTTTTNSSKEHDQKRGPAGIHFASLECDSELTSWLAGWFNMPYQLAKMTRNYYNYNDSVEEDGKKAKGQDAERERENSAHTKCSRTLHETIGLQAREYHIRSERLQHSTPSLWMLFVKNFISLSQRPAILHFTNTEKESQQSPKPSPSTSNSPCPSVASSSTSTSSLTSSGQFTVDCAWEVFPDSGSSITNKNDSSSSSRDEQQKVAVEEDFARWATERYFVYTRKYGMNWHGQVEHEPWPTRTRVQLHHLHITNVEAYQPRHMQPLVKFMSENPPDSVVFSPGVGPVEFNMLRPV